MHSSLRLFLVIFISGLLFSCSENSESSKPDKSENAELQDSVVTRTYEDLEFIYSENDLNWFGRLDVGQGGEVRRCSGAQVATTHELGIST